MHGTTGTIEGKRVAALLGDGFDEAELTETRRALEGAGAVVTIVGIDERARQRIQGMKNLVPGEALKAEEVVVDVTAEDFDALLITGGWGTDKIRNNRDVQRLVREFDSTKKPMFSIGHGAHVLISAHVTRGRTMTGSPSINDDIRNSGGLFRDQPLVQDGHWVTARGIGDIAPFNRAMLEKLAQTAGVPA
ncbi:MAG TPA: DJ-1/PfpI family protein [Candidatus Acidoferrales bacterium]|nr:DJ-1/PfpI family protein [Candidatus Acidoferrales bacterium]